MFKVSQGMLIFLAAFIWFDVGIMLSYLGAKFLLLSQEQDNLQPIAFISAFILALALGHLKSQYILSKSVRRNITRIRAFTKKVSVFQVYDIKMYILILAMIVLGTSLKHFGVPNLYRGIIDLAVGFALIRGSIFYLRRDFNPQVENF